MRYLIVLYCFNFLHEIECLYLLALWSTPVPPCENWSQYCSQEIDDIFCTYLEIYTSVYVSPSRSFMYSINVCLWRCEATDEDIGFPVCRKNTLFLYLVKFGKHDLLLSPQCMLLYQEYWVSSFSYGLTIWRTSYGYVDFLIGLVTEIKYSTFNSSNISPKF